MKPIRLILLIGVVVSAGAMSSCIHVQRESDPAVTSSTTTVQRSSTTPAATTTVERTTY
ncbi:MAG: hypothetical protein ABI615_05755 [Chthoniobacterales bacterium]